LGGRLCVPFLVSMSNHPSAEERLDMLTKNGDRVTTNGDNHSPQMGIVIHNKG